MERESELIDKVVENRFDLIKDEIQKAFPDATIESCKEKRALYKIRIDRESRPSCWLIFAWECLLDKTQHMIIDALESEKVFESLSSASEPLKILITVRRGRICMTKQI